MYFAVTFGRYKPDEILGVQFIGNTRESGSQILAGTKLNVATTGFFRDPGETGIGQIGEHRRLQPPRPDSGWA